VVVKGVKGLGFYASTPPEQYEQLVVCGELYGQRFRPAPTPLPLAIVLIMVV